MATPTKSEIRNWQTDHLGTAAKVWSGQADAVETKLNDALRLIALAKMRGVFPKTFVEQAQAFVDKAKPRVEALRTAQRAAEAAEVSLRKAKGDAVDAISAAEKDKFAVSEDLAVTHTELIEMGEAGKAREGLRRAHEATIQTRAVALAATDDAIARKLHELAQKIAAHDGTDFSGKPPEVPLDPLEEILRKYQVEEDPGGLTKWKPPFPFNRKLNPFEDGFLDEIPASEVTAMEAKMLEGMSPFELKDMYDSKTEAERESKERFPPPHHKDDTADNHTDAFRHAYWNALMTQKFGEDFTRDFTTTHERRPDNPAVAEAMDLHNNQVGREIARANPNASPEQMADLVQQAVNDGRMVVVRPDGNGLAWSNSLKQGECGITSETSVVGRPPSEVGR